MKRIIISLVIGFVFSFTFGFNPIEVNAEDVEYQIVNYTVGVNFIPVPDVEKHAIGTYERRGVAIFKNGETAAYHSRGTWDHIDENGTWQGYSTLTFEDGSTIIAKGSGNISKESGKSSTLTGKSEYIKGTGKYEGIKGNLSFSGNSITPYNDETKGDAIMNAKGSYTLPK
jgi:hypothetical protein